MTITRSELFGLDDPEGAREYLLRLGADALAQGRVFAQLDTVGRGVISGWWAVRGPGEPALSDSDLLAPRQLDAAGRAERTVLRRIARFRARADARGRLVVEGPLYRDLPVLGPGRHDLVFQLDEAFRGDAAVPIRPLAYYPVPQIPAPALNARIERLTGGAARISWIPQGDERALIARVEIRGERSAIAPYANGVMDLPAGWLPPGSAVRLSLLTPEGGVLASIDIAQ